ncbi:MAG: DUF819 domain-containing protein [Filifactoraceae bacterium]
MELKSLVSPDNTWVLWGILLGWAALSIYLEQRYIWASKVSGAIVALVGAMILANFCIIPTESPVYDDVWSYVVPMAIPLLLFKCNIMKVWRESGRLLLLFCIGAVGTVIGSIIGYHLFSDRVVDLAKAASMIGASYIGGSVNFAAMSESLSAPGELVSASIVADNLLMAFYFFILIALPSVNFFMSKFSHPYIDKMKKIDRKEGETVAAAYWGRKEISLKDIAFCFASSVIIVAVSTEMAKFISEAVPIKVVALFFGNKYLIITTITMLLATFMPNQIGEIKGSQEIGTFLIYIFFVVIGVPASIPLIIEKSPWLLAFSAVVVIVNMLIIFIAGKLLKFSLEECILASNANIGGPTTAAAMAISKGWAELVGPVMLVGTFGYVVGNYFGLLIASVLGA